MYVLVYVVHVYCAPLFVLNHMSNAARVFNVQRRLHTHLSSTILQLNARMTYHLLAKADENKSFSQKCVLYRNRFAYLNFKNILYMLTFLYIAMR